MLPLHPHARLAPHAEAVVPACLPPPHPPQSTIQNPPNILFLLSDQWSGRATDFSGRPAIPRTPALDALAAGGVRFDNAYCTYPLCAPARASQLTGLMPHKTGIVSNRRPPDLDRRELPLAGEIFEAAGYDTGYFGKEHTFRLGYRGMNELGSYQFSRPGYIADGCVLDPIFIRDAIRFIERPREQPFFAVVSTINPHDTCIVPPKVDLGGKTVMDVTRTFYKDRQYLRGLELPDPRPNRTPPPPPIRQVDPIQAGWTEDQWRRYLAVYYLLLENVDWLLGLVLDALRRSGQEQDTLILFSSDHGDLMGAHQLVGKLTFHEETMNVPFLIAYKGVIEPGHVDATHLISGEDILPTFCDYAGLQIPAVVTGRSLRPIIENKTAPWREYLVAELNNARMVRASRYKYMRYSTKTDTHELLFDLETDPGEEQPLPDTPEHTRIKHKLRNHLQQ